VNAKSLSDGIGFLRTLKPPYVLKADGLAAGKGVIITLDLNEAELTLAEMVNGKLGDAGRNVVIEEYLNGIELSMFVLTDGNHYLALPEAKDYKRIGDGDTGPNTGGMGAVSPVAFADDLWKQKVKERIIEPTVTGLRKEGRRFVGFIFIGLMNVGGDPYVIEYNVRMGDPETEVVIPRIQNDFAEILKACSLGKLDTVKLIIDPDTWLTVIAVSGGYPGDYAKGKEISGLLPGNNGVVFHSGTIQKEGRLLTNGGRVLAVCGKGKSIPDARGLAYETLKNIVFEGVFFRKDIGLDLI
jgi:phosphoribosylamine--glycine ligase